MTTTSRTLLPALAMLAGFALTAWSAPQVAPGALPGDETMSCEQIAAELVPYMQQVRPNAQALAATQQRELEQAQAKGAQRRTQHQLLAAMATAGALDPTGASKRAYVAAEMAQTAKERAEDEAQAASPQAQQAKAQREQFAAQAQAMQGDARLQRLMQLGQQKGCDRKR